MMAKTELREIGDLDRHLRLGKSYYNFVRKRALMKYQSQSENLKFFPYLEMTIAIVEIAMIHLVIEDMIVSDRLVVTVLANSSGFNFFAEKRKNVNFFTKNEKKFNAL